MQLVHPHTNISKIIAFLQKIFRQYPDKIALVGVSGGIDSALSLTLTTRALGANRVYALLMPFENQNIHLADEILAHNRLESDHVLIRDISPIVKSAQQVLEKDFSSDKEDLKVTAGNLMARARMMVMYDLAKKLNALVVGTENKSEKYLGYYTRFGDEASDVEPIVGYYKTQVKQLALALAIPNDLISRKPTAGLWEGQTDESELGFSYELADRVLQMLVDQKLSQAEIYEKIGESQAQVKKVIERFESNKYKREVPYVSGE